VVQNYHTKISRLVLVDQGPNTRRGMGASITDHLTGKTNPLQQPANLTSCMTANIGPVYVLRKIKTWGQSSGIHNAMWGCVLVLVSSSTTQIAFVKTDTILEIAEYTNVSNNTIVIIVIIFFNNEANGM
jgi:hypothetical protein